jgi:hypothetical protein
MAVSAKSCHVLGCAGSTEGQMFACAAHFGLLSEQLRLQLVEVYDQRRREERAGNLRRATREEWRTLLERANAEWGEIRERLQAKLEPGVKLSPQGRTWARMAVEEVANGG